MLYVDCSKCKVSSNCPKKGSIPLLVGTKRFFCNIIGGYGRKPVDRKILSEDSKARSDKDGPCLTLVEYPEFNEDVGRVVLKIIKVFHDPILHEREKTSFMQNALYPKNCK